MIIPLLEASVEEAIVSSSVPFIRKYLLTSVLQASSISTLLTVMKMV